METPILDKMKAFLDHAIEAMNENDKEVHLKEKEALVEMENTELKKVEKEQVYGLLHAFYVNVVKQAMFDLFMSQKTTDELSAEFYSIDFKAAKAKYDEVIKALAAKQEDIEKQSAELAEVQQELNSIGAIFNKVRELKSE